jgi:hypothetical protein
MMALVCCFCFVLLICFTPGFVGLSYTENEYDPLEVIPDNEHKSVLFEVSMPLVIIGLIVLSLIFSFIIRLVRKPRPVLIQL